MKRSLWYSIGLLLLLAGPVQAQSLTGEWQGVETDPGDPGNYWPAVLRLQKGQGADVFGILYQEIGRRPGVSVTFQMQGARTAKGLRLGHGPKLDETGSRRNSYWCEGAITFSYDPKLEKLTGHATYRPVGDCDVGTFIFYRIRLKSAAKVKAGSENTLRVSGRNVLWYADADLKQPLATGNTYRTKLRKTTTYYLKQGFYPTDQSPVTAVTITVTGAPASAPKPAPKALAAPPRVITAPPKRLDIIPPVAPDSALIVTMPALTTTPLVLPTVLFRLGTAELLPEALPALNQLAAELRARPSLELRVAGHTDRVGEPQKNLLLSEQRAAAVKIYLVKSGIAAGRISTIGYGDQRPLYASPDARNRRVAVAEVK